MRALYTTPLSISLPQHGHFISYSSDSAFLIFRHTNQYTIAVIAIIIPVTIPQCNTSIYQGSVITQVFLYKFLNDKFGYEIKNAKSELAKKINEADKWESAYAELSDTERMLLQSAISPDVPMLEPYHLIANLWNQQSKGDFDTIFDSTMTDIAEKNADIFSTQTTANTKIPLFEPLTQFVTDSAQRAPFARALVDKLANFSFEEAFEENYDFFSNIFEYLIKDYNTAGCKGSVFFKVFCVFFKSCRTNYFDVTTCQCWF